tara:strand:- start:404 stop:1417 length:1014 start_codon:yes stop_codon:yes gene_type:complete
MCIIIIKDNNKLIKTDTLVASAKINPHGLGVLWLDKWDVTYHKSDDYMILKTDRPYIAHFRFATIGKINKANCHPFNITNDEMLFQNGSIWNLGNKNKTDTQHMAEILSDIPKDRWAEVLEMSDCRFVTANLKEQTYELYNEEDWIERNGIMYSKKNVLDKTLIAVYGTLKKDCSNYFNYLTNSKYVGPAETDAKYPLIIDGLPYLLNKPGIGEHVEVDLFLIDDTTLSNIDLLEGHPQWYCREKTSVCLDDGSRLEPYIYFNDKEDSGVHHKSYTEDYIHRSYNSYGDGWSDVDTTNYIDEDCGCRIPEPMFDEYDKEWYCISCMQTIDANLIENE